jgi:hypothetical protein
MPTIEETMMTTPTHALLKALFALAHTSIEASDLTSLTLTFHCQGHCTDHCTLTVTRNPSSHRWVTTLEATVDGRYHDQWAVESTACHSLDGIEWILADHEKPR